MKVVVELLVALLNVASVFALKTAPYKVHQVTNESAWGLEERIYGGQTAEEGRFPYMIFVMMYNPNGINQCSASLIDPDWVLLAAHCLAFPGLRPNNIILIGGKANLLDYIRQRLQLKPSVLINEMLFGVQERRAKEFFIHPNFDQDSLYHDVALIRVNRPFNLGFIKTIPMANEKMKKPKYCTILGWGLTPGHTSNYKLNYVENKLVYPTAIGCKYKHEGPFICLKPGESGVCQGDSGSPLVCDNMVWGVSSHLIYDESDQCGNSLEEYYTELYPDLNWINH